MGHEPEFRFVSPKFSQKILMKRGIHMIIKTGIIPSTAFSIFGIEIYWYAIFITIAIILGYIWAWKHDGRYKIKFDDVLTLSLIMIPVGFICARLYFVLFNLYKIYILAIITAFPFHVQFIVFPNESDIIDNSYIRKLTICNSVSVFNIIGLCHNV